MSEIEKLYENAGIKKEKDYYCPNCETKLEDWFGKHKEYICPNERCDYALCDDEKDFQECLEHLSYREFYPPFTAEKQIELIKLIANSKGYPDYEHFGNLFDDHIQLLEFDEALARLVNSIWQDLTEEEKRQVKGILE